MIKVFFLRENAAFPQSVSSELRLASHRLLCVSLTRTGNAYTLTTTFIVGFGRGTCCTNSPGYLFIKKLLPVPFSALTLFQGLARKTESWDFS